jgi:hypothetical protein
MFHSIGKVCRDFDQEKTRYKYFVLSAFTLICGFFIYYFFRKSNSLIFTWFNFLPKNNNIVTFSNSSFLIDFFRYNLPDGLWLLSGLLFLRALWHENPKTLFVYKLCFLFIAFFFEFLQMFDGIAGTFDIFDLLTMGSITLLESIAHKVKLTRRKE